MPIEINHISALHSNDGVIQNQGQLFVENRSDVNESQSIDINSINLNNHVSNDCESLPIEVNHISASHSHDGIIQNQDQPLSVPLAQQRYHGWHISNFDSCFVPRYKQRR